MKKFLVLVSLALSIHAEELFRVAVLNFGARGVDSATALAVTDLLGTYLQQTGKFQVMERSAMAEVLKEQGFQQAGACEEGSCAVEIGQLLGVTHMAAGSVSKLGETYIVQSRLIDLKTGAIVKTAKEECPCNADQLNPSVNKMAFDLAGVPYQGPAPVKKSWFSKRERYIGFGALLAGAAAFFVFYNPESSSTGAAPQKPTDFGTPPGPPNYP